MTVFVENLISQNDKKLLNCTIIIKVNVNISAVGAWTGMCNGVASGIILSRLLRLAYYRCLLRDTLSTFITLLQW